MHGSCGLHLEGGSPGVCQQGGDQTDCLGSPGADGPGRQSPACSPENSELPGGWPGRPPVSRPPGVQRGQEGQGEPGQTSGGGQVRGNLTETDKEQHCV